MKISVIIPVYNAAAFLEKAVLSACEQKEVEEVILIEDGSLDGSLGKALYLEKTHQKIRLYQHSDQKNHGPGASRNLGIKKAIFPFIAFLDADDFYLPNRFLKTREVFQINQDCEGVYEAIGVHFYNEKSEKRYKQLSPYNLTTVRKKGLPPEVLPFYIIGKSGHQISLDGLTIRKKTIDRIGGFDIDLKQVQDTDFIWKLCLNAPLYPGKLDEAVTMRGVHGDNSIFRHEKVLYYRLLFAKKWFKKITLNQWDKQINRAIFRTYLEALARQDKFETALRKKIFKLVKSVEVILKNPMVLFKLLF